jgi:hypothetical protein
MRKKDLWAWVSVIAGSALAAAVLFAYYRATTGHWLPPVLPQVEEDSLYYLAQMRSVLEGRPFLGNPFIREYAGAFFPGLLLPVWIAALPGFFGLGINAVFAVDAMLFSVLTGLLLHALCLRMSGGRRTLSAALAILGVALLHNLLIRPAIMQTVYPAFGLFLLSLHAVLRSPRSRTAYAGLAVTAAVAFYLYTYLWMIAFTVIGLLFLRALLQRDRDVLLRLLVTGAAILLLCLPQLLHTVSLFRDPGMAEIVARTGLVETRRVLPLTIFNLKYTILLLATLLFLRTRRALTVPEILLALVGTSLLIGAFSNVVTGKEMDFNTHFWRFELPLGILVLAAMSPVLIGKHSRLERIAAGCLSAAFLFTIVNRTFVSANAYRYLHVGQQAAKFRALQEYERLFTFFNRNERDGAVILSNPSIAQYIPIYTNDYVFYYYRAGLHVIPTDELRMRFLAAYVNAVNEPFIRATIDDSVGINISRTALYRNAYGGNVQPLDLVGGQAFVDRIQREHAAIDKDYEGILRRFAVSYVIIDRAAGDNNPRVPAGAASIYDDKRFTIYAFR